MRRVFLVVVTFYTMLVGSVACYAAGYGTFSRGMRMGEVTKFSIKGLIYKSGEGELLMGSESVPLIITHKDSDGHITREQVNPWRFSSTDPEIQKKLSATVGEYAILEYEQAQVKGIGTDTDYEILSVNPIAPALSESCTAKNYRVGSKSDGKRSGRIVKASSKGRISKTHEIIMQQGNSGNQFHAMSISKDDALFECAVAFLKAGQKVVVEYSQSHFNLNPLARDTTYEVVKITPVKGLN